MFVNAVKSGNYSFGATHIKAAFSFYGIWNLDFFRLLYKPFCFSSHYHAQSMLALDYLVALYPLLLIVVTYTFVVLHERGHKIIIILWWPFHKFLARFRRQWNIKKSLVHAFSTFIVLSYVKMISVSFDLLLPTFASLSPYNLSETYFYYYPDKWIDKSEKTVVFGLAIVVSLICFLLPLLLLLAYPCHCFQRAFNIKSPAIHIFMDTLIGCYRQKPACCQAFAGIYFLFRLIILVVFELTMSLTYLSSVSVMVLLVAVLLAVARPY
jgi:hypothetical protein